MTFVKKKNERKEKKERKIRKSSKKRKRGRNDEMGWRRKKFEVEKKKIARYDRDIGVSFFFFLSCFKLIATLVSIEEARYECLIKV